MIARFLSERILLAKRCREMEVEPTSSLAVYGTRSFKEIATWRSLLPAAWWFTGHGASKRSRPGGRSYQQLGGLRHMELQRNRDLEIAPTSSLAVYGTWSFKEIATGRSLLPAAWWFTGHGASKKSRDGGCAYQQLGGLRDTELQRNRDREVAPTSSLAVYGTRSVFTTIAARMKSASKRSRPVDRSYRQLGGLRHSARNEFQTGSKLKSSCSRLKTDVRFPNT